MPLELSIVGKPQETVGYTYTWKEVVLYALGIGAKRDELDYLYEGKGPKVYPSFAVVPKFEVMVERLSKCGGNLATVVHGGEKVVLHKPIAPAGALQTTGTILPKNTVGSPNRANHRSARSRWLAEMPIRRPGPRSSGRP